VLVSENCKRGHSVGLAWRGHVNESHGDAQNWLIYLLTGERFFASARGDREVLGGERGDELGFVHLNSTKSRKLRGIRFEDDLMA